MYLCICIPIVQIHTYSTNAMYTFVGITIQNPSSFIYLPNLTLLPIELICDVNNGIGWRVNNTAYFIVDLMNGHLSGHNTSVNGSNIVISTPINNTEYVCNNRSTDGEPYNIFVAGEYMICCV